VNGFIRGIIWDVDGTLADTLDLCVSALGTAITSFGGPSLTREEIHGRFGPTEGGILRNELGDVWPEAMEVFLDEYRSGHAGVQFPVVNGVVRQLFDAGIPQSVVTGKGLRSAQITLEAIDLVDVFEDVAAGSMEGPVKAVEIARIVEQWGFDPSEVAYIGDAPSDVRSSREAGVVAVTAAWKSGADAERLSSLGPDVMLRSESELAQWVADTFALPR